jgi:hypothetical protein
MAAGIIVRGRAQEGYMDTPLRRKITQSPVPTQLSSQRQ